MEPSPTRDRKVSGKKLICVSPSCGRLTFEGLTILKVSGRHRPQWPKTRKYFSTLDLASEYLLLMGLASCVSDYLII